MYDGIIKRDAIQVRTRMPLVSDRVYFMQLMVQDERVIITSDPPTHLTNGVPKAANGAVSWENAAVDHITTNGVPITATGRVALVPGGRADYVDNGKPYMNSGRFPVEVG